MSDLVYKIRSMYEEGITDCKKIGEKKDSGGQQRGKKGEFVPQLCELFIRGSWDLLGGDFRRISVVRKHILVPVSTVGNAGSVKIEIDSLVGVDGKPVTGFECKAYTENAMMKRVLFDYSALVSHAPEFSTVFLFQLQNAMGDGLQYKIGEALNSRLYNMARIQMKMRLPEIRVVTLLPESRSSLRALHDADVTADLSDDRISEIIDVFKDTLRKFI